MAPKKDQAKAKDKVVVDKARHSGLCLICYANTMKTFGMKNVCGNQHHRTAEDHIAKV
jgi:hypothetical protein